MNLGGEGDNRGWDGWMASPTLWTWVWVSSGSCWWTGKPGMLQSTGSQRIGHNWVTELNWWCLYGAGFPLILFFLNFLLEYSWFLFLLEYSWLGFPHSSVGKESAWNLGDLRSIPRSGRFPWRRKWQPTPVFLPGESQGQRRLSGCILWGCKSRTWLSDQRERERLCIEVK